MRTAKVFMSGTSQVVRLPKEYRFSDAEVGIKRVGDLVVLYPQERADDLFYSSLGNFTDDFFASIRSAKAEPSPQSPRETI